ELDARLRQHDVAGLQVAVNDALLVRLVQGGRDLDSVAEDLLGRERSAAEAVCQRLALQELHDQVLGAVLVADVVEREAVRVRRRGYGLRLSLEALPDLLAAGEMRGKDLDGDRAVQPRVLRLVDLTHPSRPDGREDLVRTQTSPLGKRHLSVGFY